MFIVQSALPESPKGICGKPGQSRRVAAVAAAATSAAAELSLLQWPQPAQSLAGTLSPRPPLVGGLKVPFSCCDNPDLFVL